MKIRTQIQILFCFVIFLTSVIFTLLIFFTQQQLMLNGIDQQLFTAAEFARSVLPADYHDRIENAQSVSQSEYQKIVQKWDELCLKLDLQYIWSLMIYNDTIVFTSGTSPSKDVNKQDYAPFFDIHTNPEVYQQAFSTMQVQYSTFQDKWGAGRMVLIPEYDNHGRKYLFAASRRLDLVESELNQTLIRSLTIGFAMFMTGVIISLFFANSLSKPITQLKEIAEKVAAGELYQPVQVSGSIEITSLASSFSEMNMQTQKTMERLRESELLYRTLFNLESDAILLIDNTSGNILAANDAACEMYGYSMEEILLIKNYELTVEYEKTKLFTTTTPIDQQKVVYVPLHHHRNKSGNPFLVEMTGRFFTWQGKSVHIEAIRDITDRQKAQILIQNQNDELLAQNEELIAQANTLQELEADLVLANTHLEQRVSERTKQLELVVQELEAFAYSVSHDLRAPLRAIDGYCQMLSEDYAPSLDNTGKHYIARTRAGAQQMGQLIEDLLRLSSISRADTIFHQFNLSTLVNSICIELKSIHPESKLTFSIQENVIVNADSNLMRVALENLIRNAWKFSSNNSLAHIQFGTIEQDFQTVYFIQDNGVGFDMTYADKLFLPFQRLHNHQEYEGSGVGLALVQRVIKLHRGKIWAKGETDKGATFYFTLA